MFVYLGKAFIFVGNSLCTINATFPGSVELHKVAVFHQPDGPGIPAEDQLTADQIT